MTLLKMLNCMIVNVVSNLVNKCSCGFMMNVFRILKAENPASACT